LWLNEKDRGEKRVYEEGKKKKEKNDNPFSNLFLGTIIKFTKPLAVFSRCSLIGREGRRKKKGRGGAFVSLSLASVGPHAEKRKGKGRGL